MLFEEWLTGDGTAMKQIKTSQLIQYETN